MNASLHHTLLLRPLPVASACDYLWAAPPSWSQSAEGARNGATLKELAANGSHSECNLEEVPASIDVLSGEALDPARVQGIGSLAREGNAGFNFRGLEGNRVLLVLHDVRVPRELSSGVLGSAAFGRDYFDLGLITRVKIVRGAYSALYGSDGLAGMVAMYTTEPAPLIRSGQTFAGRVGLALYSEDGTRTVDATLAGSVSDSLHRLGSVQTGRRRALDNQDANHSQSADRTAPKPQDDRNISVLGMLVLKPEASRNHTLTLELVDIFSEAEGCTGRATAMGFVSLDLDGTSDTRRTRASWDGRDKRATAWVDKLRITLGYQASESQETTVEQWRALTTRAHNRRSRAVTYREDLWQGVLQAEKTTALGARRSTNTVYGLDVSEAKPDNLVKGTAPPAYKHDPLKRYPPTWETTTALFVQSEFANERWSLIPALRHDRIDLTPKPSELYPLEAASLSESAVSPTLGVVFRAAPGLGVYGNVAARFRAPSPLKLNNYYENPFGNYRSIPNPDLKPKTSRTVKLGTHAATGALNCKASVFNGRSKDFIEDLVQVSGKGRPANPIQFRAINRGQVHLSGFEVKGKLAIGKHTDPHLAYGQTRGTDTGTETDQHLNSVNPASFTLGVDQKLGEWTDGALLTHVESKSEKHVDFSAKPKQLATPSCTTLELGSTWQLRQGLKHSAALGNLIDAPTGSGPTCTASPPTLPCSTATQRQVATWLWRWWSTSDALQRDSFTEPKGERTMHQTSCEACDEEYTLPPVEALMAGTLALLTGYAQSAPDCPHRPLMAAKLVSNLFFLSGHPDLSGPMQTMLGNLRTRWQLEVDRQPSRGSPSAPTPLWHAAPAGVQ